MACLRIPTLWRRASASRNGTDDEDLNRMRCSVILGTLVLACSPDAPLEELGGGERGLDRGALVCRSLSASACDDAPECLQKLCPDCEGRLSFTVCFPSEGAEPSCPDLACPPPPPCASLEPETCRGRADCQERVCSPCREEIRSCIDLDTLPAPCPRPACLDCGGLGEEACIDAEACHPVYVDEGALCDCQQPGCCTRFSQCAEGGFAQCAPPVGGVLCDALPPRCDLPELTVGYTEFCYEGCVRLEDCVF